MIKRGNNSTICYSNCSNHHNNNNNNKAIAIYVGLLRVGIYSMPTGISNLNMSFWTSSYISLMDAERTTRSSASPHLLCYHNKYIMDPSLANTTLPLLSTSSPISRRPPRHHTHLLRLAGMHVHSHSHQQSSVVATTVTIIIYFPFEIW